MKRILFILISLSILISCGKIKKEDTIEKTKIESTQKNKLVINEKSFIEDGAANILITTNDVMIFDLQKFTAKAGQKVKLTLTHTGKSNKEMMGHNVVILQQGASISEFAEKAVAYKENDYIPVGTTEVIAYTKIIGGGETTTIEFTAPKVGTYDFICSFPGHIAFMKGKFIVE